MCVVDLHNHIVTEDVVAFLAREGGRLATRIVETREGRFAQIGDAAVRPLHARMCDPAARASSRAAASGAWSGTDASGANRSGCARATPASESLLTCATASAMSAGASA